VSFVAQGRSIEVVPAFGAEGTCGCTSATKVRERQKHCAPTGDISPGAGGSTGEMSKEARRDWSKIPCCFGAEGATLQDTWLLRTCKGAPCEAETRGAACKGVSAVRRHAGGLYDAGSYCYTLVKCLKPFVRNGKGVIEANDYTQGSHINSEPPCNETDTL
jgi:hypothetical protein